MPSQGNLPYCFNCGAPIKGSWDLSSLLLIAVIFLVVGMLVGVGVGYGLFHAISNESNNNPSNTDANPSLYTSQPLKIGDYVLYDVSVNGESATRRYDVTNVNGWKMTMELTSTTWYFSSVTHTYNYTYLDGKIIISDLTGIFTDSNKIAQLQFQTNYGLKNASVFSYWQPGPYSNALRTYYVPNGCLLFFKYYGNDTSGNQVVQTLSETNIEWLKNVGNVSNNGSNGTETNPSLNTSQPIKVGDYLLYDVTVNGDSATRRYDITDVNGWQMTVQLTSTTWYFLSVTHTYNYTYQDGKVIISDVTGIFNDSNKVEQVNFNTAYGVKNASVYSYWQPGPYSNALRTYYVPSGCLVFFKYYGNDTDGNRVEQTLRETNIQWLKSIGNVQ